LKVEKSVWEGGIRKDANEKDLGSRYRSQGDVQTAKRKNLPFFQKRKGGSSEFCGRPIENGVY